MGFNEVKEYRTTDNAFTGCNMPCGMVQKGSFVTQPQTPTKYPCLPDGYCLSSVPNRHASLTSLTSSVSSLESYRTAVGTPTPKLVFNIMKPRIPNDLRRSFSQSTVLYTPKKRYRDIFEKKQVVNSLDDSFQTNFSLQPHTIYEDTALYTQGSTFKDVSNHQTSNNFLPTTVVDNDTNTYENTDLTITRSVSTVTQDLTETTSLTSLLISPASVSSFDYGFEANHEVTDAKNFQLLKKSYIQLESDFNLLLAQYTKLMDLVVSLDENSTMFSKELFKPKVKGLNDAALIPKKAPGLAKSEKDLEVNQIPRKKSCRPVVPDITSPNAMISTIKERQNIRIRAKPRKQSLKYREDMLYPIHQRIDPRRRPLLSRSRAYHPWGFKPETIIEYRQKRGTRIPTNGYDYRLHSTSTDAVARRFQKERFRLTLKNSGRNFSSISFTDMPVARPKGSVVYYWGRFKRIAARVWMPRCKPK